MDRLAHSEETASGWLPRWTRREVNDLLAELSEVVWAAVLSNYHARSS